MSHPHNAAEPATEPLPVQRLDYDIDGYDEPAFPLARVVSFGVVSLLFGGIGVIVVLAYQATFPTLLGLLAFGIGAYLLATPVQAILDWYHEVYVYDEDDDLDGASVVVELGDLADDGLGLFDQPAEPGGQP